MLITVLSTGLSTGPKISSPNFRSWNQSWNSGASNIQCSLVTYFLPGSQNANKQGSMIGRCCAHRNTIIANPFLSPTRKYIQNYNWTWVQLYTTGFTDCFCVHVRVMASVDVNFAKYPTGVRPLLVYYWMGPRNSQSRTGNFHSRELTSLTEHQ